jgi:hypothetical protein
MNHGIKMWVEELMKQKNILLILFRSVQVLDHGIASYIQFGGLWYLLLAILVQWGYGINERVQVTVNT